MPSFYDIVQLNATFFLRYFRFRVFSQSERMKTQPFDTLVSDWISAGCPDKEGGSRPPAFCARAAALLEHPLAYFGSGDVALIGPKMVRGYGAWRQKRVANAKYAGTRAADIELATCSSMGWWAYFDERVTANPFAVKFRFHKADAVHHSPERAPQTADEVHAIGERLLANPRTASSGFLWLFLSMTGCRTGELRCLRLDVTQEGQSLPPGWHSDEEIVITRGKKRGKDAIDVLRLSEPAKSLLAAWERWHAAQYPLSHWWFPGKGGSGPLNVSTLTRSAKEAARALGLRPKISAHGCRSFFCSVLRTLESDDRKVADALGHSNTTMVSRVYGRRAMLTDGLSWLPKSGKPGWAKWATETAP
jgi:integrase